MRLIAPLLAIIVVAGLLYAQLTRSDSERVLPFEVLRDKVRGGWAGQMIGVSYGAPTEFKFNERIITGPINWEAGQIRNALDQDDLYVDMTFASVLDKVGLDATTEQFGEMFRDSKYRLWHANLAARRALKRGIKSPLSGSPQYNVHANDIDFQIESDFIGLMCPGLPQASNLYCERVGHVMNYGDGVYGGMFVCGMYAAAFFEQDVRKVVQTGLKCMPRESEYAQLIADVLDWSLEYPDNWQKVWWKVEQKWNKNDPCPAGALRPFNIDAKLNGAYIAIGLLYGEGDFEKTLEITTRCGQDSDCNPSNAAGILGTMIGYSRIPEIYKKGLAEIADEKFAYTDYSFNTIVDSTIERAKKVVVKNGGRVDYDRIIVPEQHPVPAKLEQWNDYGQVLARIDDDDPRWRWEGNWEIEKGSRFSKGSARTADSQGAEASFEFEGTGVIISGPYRPDGGRLEVYLDGKLQGTFDVYNDGEAGWKGSESVWHVFGLVQGRHTVRLVVRGEPQADSKGSKVTIDDAIIFGLGK